MYIVIEGQDASGKTTQADILVKYFEAQGKKVVTYSEAGTGSKDKFISTIAKLNYGSKQDIDNRTRVLLYIINRYEQWRKIAEPALKNNDVVIITRNWFSTLIYEGYGGGVSRSLITKLHKDIMPDKYFHPDLTFILTVNEDEQVKRLAQQHDENWDRSQEFWKSQGGEFQRKINQAYLKVAKDFDVPVLDASGSIEEVFQAITQQIENYTVQHKSHFVSAVLDASPAPQYSPLASPELNPSSES